MKPIAHGASGFASGSYCRREPTHIEIMRQYSTPCIRDVERERELSEAANLPYRSVTELYRGSRYSHSRADYSFPVVWNPYFLARYWADQCYLHWSQYHKKFFAS